MVCNLYFPANTSSSMRWHVRRGHNARAAGGVATARGLRGAGARGATRRPPTRPAVALHRAYISYYICARQTEVLYSLI